MCVNVLGIDIIHSRKCIKYLWYTSKLKRHETEAGLKHVNCSCVKGCYLPLSCAKTQLHPLC